MNEYDWTKEFPSAITVCSVDGLLLEMDDKAAENLAQDGGRLLLGNNILDCHPQAARTKTEHMLASAARNVYSIEKNGLRKLIFQSPWFKYGHYAGLVELSLEIPDEIPHFIRS